MKPAFLIIDMQYGLSDVWTEDIIKNQLKLLEYCRKIDADAFLINIEGEGPTENRILKSWNNIKKKHKSWKTHSSAFRNTNLQNELVSIQADYLIGMGVNSSCCFYDTVKTALNFGYAVGISKDTTNEISDLKWYKENTDLFDNYKELISHLNKI